MPGTEGPRDPAALLASENVALPVRALAAAAAAGLTGVLAWIIVDLPREAGGLTEAVRAALPRTGVTQPVTAVLLNVRAWDTWLELAVLLVALAGSFALHRAGAIERHPPPQPGLVLDWSFRILAPAAVLVGGLLLWLGTHAAGGAFQAGAVLGAAAILAWLAGRSSVGGLAPGLVRLGAIAGAASFSAGALATLVAGRPALHLRPPAAGGVIVAIEIAATVAVALTLAALFLVAGRGRS